MTHYPLVQLDKTTRLLISWQTDLPVGPVQVYELNRTGLHPITRHTENAYLYGYPALLDHQIFYTTQHGDTGHLYLMDRDRRIERELAANGRVKHDLSLSPDGRLVAYWEHPAPTPTGGELIIHDWQNDKRVAVQPGHRILDWHWSPDSESLVGVSWGGRHTPHWYRFARDGTPITSRPLTQFDDKQAMTLSPDWQHIAYTDNHARLSIADILGHDAQTVGFLNDRESPPVWSPDSRWLAWAGSLDHAEMDEHFDLCIASRDGQERTALMRLDEADDSRAISPCMPAWSADSRRIAIASYNRDLDHPQDEGTAIFTIAIDTRTIQRVSDRAGIVFRLAWI